MSKALFLYILRILLNSHAKTLPLSPRRRALIIPCLFTLLSLHFSTFLLLQTCAQYWQGNEKLKKYSSRRVSSTICRGDTDTEFFCRFMKNYPNSQAAAKSRQLLHNALVESPPRGNFEYKGRSQRAKTSLCFEK